MVAANTIHTLNRKVAKGLEKAREYAKDDPELLAFLDILEFSYRSRVEDVISLASNIWAFNERSKEASIAWMQEKRDQINRMKLPNTSIKSEFNN